CRDKTSPESVLVGYRLIRSMLEVAHESTAGSGSRGRGGRCRLPGVDGWHMSPPLDPGPGVAEDGVGYRGVMACHAAGISYRQLDYWARTGLVVPSVRDASGSGTPRLYSFR